MRALTHALSRLECRGRRLWSLVVVLCVVLISVVVFTDVEDSALKALNQKLEYLNSFEWQSQSTGVVDGKGAAEDMLPPLDGIKDHNRTAIIMFARNSDVVKVMETMRSFEDRFNKVHRYDWLFISDAQHSLSFRRSTTALTNSNVTYHHIPKSPYLTAPTGLDKKRITESRKGLRGQKTNQAKTQRQKNLQRFWSKDIFNMDFLKDYDYYIKLNPGGLFYCDISYDPVQYMKQHGKSHAFAFSMQAKVNGFPTLWSTVLQYVVQHPGDINSENSLDFISNGQGESFNGCQLSTNFEVGSLHFLRSRQYQELAEVLISENGIYYESWDDSTIRTIGVVLLLNRNQIHFINGLGYAEGNLKQCPLDSKVRLDHKCTCDPLDDTVWLEESCVRLYHTLNCLEVPSDVGLREEQQRIKAELDAQRAEEEKYVAEQLAQEKKKEEEEVKELLKQNGDPPEVLQQED